MHQACNVKEPHPSCRSEHPGQKGARARHVGRPSRGQPSQTARELTGERHMIGTCNVLTCAARLKTIPSARSLPHRPPRAAVQFIPGSQTWHASDRFTSIRFFRASILAASSSSGTASPVPKYVSFGAWPRNAECGSCELCSLM